MKRVGDERHQEKLVFLPGAGGDIGLWRPVSEGLTHRGRRCFMRWPGFGGAPPDASVGGLEDLARNVMVEMTEPVVLFAQSMGGLIALRAALALSQSVRALVLSVTSGGIDVAALGALDWRPQFAKNNPTTPRWFLDAHDDLSEPLKGLHIPTLLLWGDADPISPVRVGERLAELLPAAELVVVPGGTHDLVAERVSDVLPNIERFLQQALP